MFLQSSSSICLLSRCISGRDKVKEFFFRVCIAIATIIIGQLLARSTESFLYRPCHLDFCHFFGVDTLDRLSCSFFININYLNYNYRSTMALALWLVARILAWWVIGSRFRKPYTASCVSSYSTPGVRRASSGVSGGGVTSGKRNAFIPETRSVPLVSSPPPPSPSLLSLPSSLSLWLGREPLPFPEGIGPAFDVGWGLEGQGRPS